MAGPRPIPRPSWASPGDLGYLLRKILKRIAILVSSDDKDRQLLDTVRDQSGCKWLL